MKWKLVALVLVLSIPALARAQTGAHRLYLCAREAANHDCGGTALRLIERAIALEPEVGEYRRLRGELLRDIGWDRAAVAELERARLSGEAIAVQRASSALHEMGVDHHSVPLDLGNDTPAVPAR